ncbi:MAG: FlgD immunoglobulin-like domain containing protein [Candidatus Syntrophosphaera sp.]
MTGTQANCEYDNWISHLAEGIARPNYNTYAPYDQQSGDFGDFRDPNPAENQYWSDALALFTAGYYQGAQDVFDANDAPFQVVEFHDTDTSRTYYIIREIPNLGYHDGNGTEDTHDDEDGAFDYGWGLFIHSPGGTKPVIVTVPHPCDDFPTPLIGCLAFQTWNARYLLINGAGREVLWTNAGVYDNSKSLSDPTRNANHPLDRAYRKFADKIRSDTNQREFSAQIHSYDWDQHAGKANCQISAGNPRPCPNLPIRDLSDLKHDLINQGSHLMIPANTIGIHTAVYLNDFYSVNYSTHEFTFSDGEHTYPVNADVDLPAYTGNLQMIYTQSGTSDYDVYEPFFHIEQDELPNAYAQTNATYKWFWGWDETDSQWNMDALFDNFASYYSRWIDDMEPMLAEMFQMNDGSSPSAPTGLGVATHTETTVTLAWEASSDYDFDTYEVLIATEPIGESNYQVFSRDDDEYLASQDCEGITISSLVQGAHYYFQVRARDKNGNYSTLSNQADVVLDEQLPVVLSNFTVTLTSLNQVRLNWVTQSETDMLGFCIFRSQAQDAAQALLISPVIAATNTSSQQTYIFTDAELFSDGVYYYWLQCLDLDGSCEFHGPVSFVYSATGSESPPPSQFVTGLGAIYPNPFNPVCFIPFSLRSTANVSFRIYNARGQLLRELRLGSKEAGRHRIIWDGCDTNGKASASGVYHIIMEAGRQSFSRKAFLLK